MCKICTSCKGVMNYDPYFEAEVCGRCGYIERVSKEKTQKKISGQPKSPEVLKQIMLVMGAHS